MKFTAICSSTKLLVFGENYSQDIPINQPGEVDETFVKSGICPYFKFSNRVGRALLYINVF